MVVSWVRFAAKPVEVPPPAYNAPENNDYLVLHRIADAQVAALQRAIRDVWDNYREGLDLDDIERQLTSRGTVELDWTKLAADFRTAVVPILGGIAKQSALKTIPLLHQRMRDWRAKHPKFADPTAPQSETQAWYNVAFNLQDKGAESFLEQYLPTLITRETNETRDAIRNIVLNGFQTAVHPYQQAEQIQQIIGMNGPQAESYAKYLLSGPTATQAQAYAQNLIQKRAVLIARTETLRAANTGQVDMWVEASNQGLLQTQNTVETWIVTPDDRLCQYCNAMDGATAPVKGDFDGGGFGPLGNPPLHPDCRCTLGLDFTNLPEWAHSAAPTTVSLPATPGEEVLPSLPAVTQQIQTLYTSGMSKADIANQLGVPYQKVWQATKNIPKPEWGVSSGVAKVEKAVTSKIPVGEPGKVVQELGGSTGAKLVDVNGKMFVQKAGASVGHITDEQAANDVYRTLGVHVPASSLVDVNGKTVLRSDYLPDTRTLADYLGDPTVSAAAKSAVEEQLRQGFATDALLGNWDVLGLGGDNILVDANGTAWRIDNGGALRYRAQGALKGDLFGTNVGELQTLKSKTLWGKQIYGPLDNSEVKDQVQTLLNNRQKILDALPADLRDTVSKRLDNMAEQVGLKTTTVPAEPSWFHPLPKPTPPPIPSGSVTDQIKGLYGQGVSKAEIAKQLGVPYQKVYQVTKGLAVGGPEEAVAKAVVEGGVSKAELASNVWATGVAQADPQGLAGIQKAVDKFVDYFPSSILSEGVKFQAEVPEIASYASTVGGKVTFNLRYFGKGNFSTLSDSLAKAIKTLWHPPRTASAEGVALHEFGHVLNNKLTTLVEQGTLEKGYLWATPEAKSAFAEMKSIAAEVVGSGKVLSGYASMSADEAFGELFSAAYLTPHTSSLWSANGLLTRFEKSMQDLSTAIKDAQQTALGKTTQDLSTALGVSTGRAEKAVAEVTTSGYKDFTTRYGAAHVGPIQGLESSLPGGATARSALREYTGSAYANLNSYLRGLSGSFSPDMLANLDRAFAASKGLGENLILRRGGFGGEALQSWFGSDIAGTLGRLTYEDASAATLENLTADIVGKVIEDKAFMSTSVLQGFGGSYKLVIEAPKGTKGIYVESLTGSPGEQEVLLNRGTKLAITGVRVETVKGVWGTQRTVEILCKVLQ